MRVALQPDLSDLAEKLEAIDGVKVIILPTPEEFKDPIEVDALLGTANGHAQLPKFIKHCVGLKWIHILGAGADGYPLELLRGKLVTCSRGATAGPISEWVLAMILAYEKQLPFRWLSEPPDAWYMADLGTLENKTLGILGFGAIGQSVAKKALAFDMNVIAKVRTHRDSPMAGVSFVKEIDALLSQSDHVVLALPSTPDSRQLIDLAALNLMKPHAHLINVSRADLIDQDALHGALDNERIGRASLDVVNPEPLPRGHWMYSHPKIFLSAHISWSSPTSQARILSPFFENLRAFTKGESLTGLVDTKLGY